MITRSDKAPVKNNTLMSEEVHEIITFKPHWIIRNGNTFLFIALMLFLSFTWFIQYPDIIRGSIKLVAVNAPKLVITKTEGKLERLLVSNEQIVEQEQMLAFLQSTAVHEQVLALQRWVHETEPIIAKDSFEILLAHPLPFYDKLGEIQPTYQDFQNVQKETLQILTSGYYWKKKNALLKDNSYLSTIRRDEHEQLKLIRQDYELQQTQYKANETLTKARITAPVELNQSKNKVISKEQSVQQANAQLINNDIVSHNKQKEITELEKIVGDQKQKFRSGLFNLKNKIEAWTLQYIVVAPQAGKVLFTSFLQQNQLLNLGQELFYIQPPQNQYYGQMMVPQTGLGKIKKGQKVLVRMESYPSNEFGYLVGTVNFISNIPTVKDSFLISVSLENGLRTNYNKVISFRNNLSAQGEVMTNNRRLFDRFLGQLREIVRRQ